MIQERSVMVDGKLYYVVLSDEQEALHAANAAGRAIIGVLGGEKSCYLSPARYVVERIQDADDEYLEQVVRRHLLLPWIICLTPRLMIREFCMEDLEKIMVEEEDTLADSVFYSPEELQAYIEHQYGFYQYGIWAIVDRQDGRILGKAGLSDLKQGELFCGGNDNNREAALELGYHIFYPYRRQGFAEEACRGILTYAVMYLKRPIYARIDPSNEASIRLATLLGFQLMAGQYSGAMQRNCLYEWCCSESKKEED